MLFRSGERHLLFLVVPGIVTVPVRPVALGAGRAEDLVAALRERAVHRAGVARWFERQQVGVDALPQLAPADEVGCRTAAVGCGGHKTVIFPRARNRDAGEKACTGAWGTGIYDDQCRTLGDLYRQVAAVGGVVHGWASTVGMLSLLGGIQLVTLGVVGEYLGRLFLSSLNRPTFVVREQTGISDRTRSVAP